MIRMITYCKPITATNKTTHKNKLEKRLPDYSDAHQTIITEQTNTI